MSLMNSDVKRRKLLLVGAVFVSAILACTFGQNAPPPAAPEPASPTQINSTPADAPLPTAGPPPPGDVLVPNDLEYCRRPVVVPTGSTAARD